VVDASKKWHPDFSIMVSHYHDDHIAGFRNVIKERIEPPPKGGPVVYKERVWPGAIYQAKLETKTNPTSFCFVDLQQDIQDVVLSSNTTFKKKGTRLIELLPGGLDPATQKRAVIDLGSGAGGIPITVTVIASGQRVSTNPGFTDIASLKSTTDQNDRSVVAMLQYGSFRYFLGGDIAGNGLAAGGNTGTNAMVVTKKKGHSKHADVETTIRTAVQKHFPQSKSADLKKTGPKFLNAGYCTVMKADHHGSSSSDDVYLLSTMRPLLFLLSTGIKARWHSHPTQQVLDRAAKSKTPKWGRPGGLPDINNSIDQIYITEIVDKHKGKKFGAVLNGSRILGDIVVRPLDDSVLAVQNATKPGTQLTVQVYGMGLFTELADPSSSFVTATVKTTTGKPYYPIGYWEHSDTH
jgi:beta-lactamase superfamily II metal-dependent hydrolase